MAMSTCSDPINMSPQALKPLALQIGDAGTANQIVMVIERKLRGSHTPTGGGVGWGWVMVRGGHYWRLFRHRKSFTISKSILDFVCVFLQGRNCRDGGVQLLSTTGPTGHSGTSRVIPVIYPLQRTEELKCICNINNSNRLIFLHWGAGRVQRCFRKRMGVASAAGPSCPCGSD